MSKQSRYPYPVYVATFADGRTGRLSFWSPQGKPMDFARGRRASEILYGRPDSETEMKVYPLAQITAGHVEWNGEQTADPYFMPGLDPAFMSHKVKRDWKALAAAVRALLEAGQSDAALDMLKAA